MRSHSDSPYPHHPSDVAEEGSTVGDLRHRAIVNDAEITEAVDAYLANPKLTAFQFTSGHVIDVRAAVNAYRPAKAILAGKITSDAHRRSIIRAAVILAVSADP
jgi:hypothetical protein